MTNPTNPFAELNRFFERMQGDFEEKARSWSEESAFVSSSVRVDLEDRDDEFVLTAELPGFEKDDIDVRVTDRTLRLEAEHAEETEKEEGGGIRSARSTPCIGRPVDIPPRGRGGGRYLGHVQKQCPDGPASQERTGDAGQTDRDTLIWTSPDTSRCGSAS